MYSAATPPDRQDRTGGRVIMLQLPSLRGLYIRLSQPKGYTDVGFLINNSAVCCTLV